MMKHLVVGLNEVTDVQREAAREGKFGFPRFSIVETDSEAEARDWFDRLSISCVVVELYIAGQLASREDKILRQTLRQEATG